MGTKTSAETNLASGSIDGTEEVRVAKSGSNFRVAFSSLLTWLAGATGFLKRDGTTTGATAGAQEFTNGVTVTGASTLSYINANGQVAASNVDNSTFAFLDPDGTVVSSDGTQTTTLSPDGSILQGTGTGLTATTVVTKTTRVRLTSLQLQGLDGTPIELVATPGAGKVIKVLSVAANYNFGTTPYDSSPLYIFIDAVGDHTVNYQYAIHQDFMATMAGNSNAQGVFLEDYRGVDILIANSPLLITSGDMGNAGDGTVDIYLTYQIITL